MKAIIADLKRAHAEALAHAKQLEQAIHALSGTNGSKRTGRKHHTMSAAGRARIAAAQRARWAKIRRGK